MTEPGTHTPHTGPHDGPHGAPDSGQVLVASSDHWLDDVTAPANPAQSRATLLAMSTFAGPSRLLRRVLAFVTTTPGKLFTVTVILTLAIAAAGMSMSNSSAQRQRDLDVLLNVTEPMSNSAHNLYTSLSLADTLATTGFVQAGVETESNQRSYYEAVDRAASAATESVLGTQASDQRIRNLVGFIQRQLPVYTGMVESARVNHRGGNAVAVAYMSNASALMREDILPAAAELFRLTSAKVNEEHEALTKPQWVPLSGLLAAVLFLLLAQWWLFRLTRRRINRGFAAATVFMLVAMAWVAGSNLASWSAGARGFEEASHPWDALTASRIEAQQARTEETLALVRRQSREASESNFQTTVSNIRGALNDFEASEAINPTRSTYRAQLLADSRESLGDWEQGHSSLVAALREGNYDRAIHLAASRTPLPDEPSTSANAFSNLDVSLAKLIADSRQAMRSFIQDSLSAMTMVSTAVLLLTFGAIIAVWLGIRARLQEYL
ncbi:hypothetical protein [Corynebacterium endometrii]|nr:hypothetical protein [Corynebacterium endometrii]